jgi:GAF domain-containing protein
MDRPAGDVKPQPGPCHEAAAQELGSLVAKLVSDRTRVERALGEREAELGTNTPIVDYPRTAAHLSERLAAVLRGGAKSLGCSAAAMYLLDDDTSELKLRAEWGLGADKLAEPARPLADALADLEALCGHAVVLEEEVIMDLWKVPEPCKAAICVPISGPSTVLGTLWFYCDAARKFTDVETNLAEILAGRLAAELDREALVLQLQSQRGNSLTAAMGNGLTASRPQS